MLDSSPASTATTPKALCNTCKTIDFASYFRDELIESTPTKTVSNDSEGEYTVDLGTRFEVRRKASFCAFCFLADAAINPSAAIAYDRDASLSIRRFLLAENHGSQTPKNKTFCIRVTARTDDEARRTEPVADIQILEEDARKLGVSTLFRSRTMRKEGFDMAVARNWIDTCLTRHGELCSTPGRSPEERMEPPQPVDLLAIDLHDMCIVDMPFGSDFVALSYCWPVTRYVTLLKENRKEFSSRNGLVPNMNKLPGTVQDAINCAKDLSFRYLWIDALCIVQDDDEHRGIHLRQMDRVYSAAALTIVCAYPVEPGTNDPCGGLPGYENQRSSLPIARSRRIENIQGLQMTAMTKCADHVLERTRWDTRCWTFQEHHLSRRLLYFTDVQVYWSCPCASFCEDVVCENVEPTASIAAGSTTWSPRARYTRNEEGNFGQWALTRAPTGGVGISMDSYSVSLSHYTNRDVSYPSDILNAFEGVAVVMGTAMQSDFWQGIPELFFDQALCWVLRGPFRRRRVRPGPTEQAPKGGLFPFPTWSWAGWSVPVNLNDYMPISQHQSELDWFIITQTGKATCLNTATEEGVVQYSVDGNKDISPPDVDVTEFLPKIQPRMLIDPSAQEWRDARTVATWTTSTSFTIDGTFHSLNRHEGVWYNSTNVAIKDSNGITAGCILVPIDFAEDCQAQPRKCEFMLVTRSLRRFDRQFERDLRYFDTSVYPERDWCTLNVMLIRRCAPYTAERFAVGVIHEDAWVNADPLGAFIQLV